MSQRSGAKEVRSGARVATAPVNWNNDDLAEWRPRIPLARLLDAMRDAGYRTTEYGADFPTNVPALQDVLNNRDMSLCGAFHWLPFHDGPAFARALDDLRPTFELFRQAGCRNLIVADAMTPERIQLAGHVPADGSASLDDAGFAQIAAGTARVAELARAYGIGVHFHNHVGSFVETPAEVDRLRPLLKERGLDFCFDTGHYAYGGGDPAAFVREHAGAIGYLHLKDVDRAVLTEARQRGWSFLDALRHIVFAPFGAGIVDITGIVSILNENGFDGWIVVEQDTCADDPTETARHNLDYLLAHTSLTA